MHQPPVAIVVIQFNRFDEVKQCLESIFEQDYKNFHLIVIDNASTDHSLEFLKAQYHDKATIIENSQNMGYTGGVNIGVAKALELGCKYLYLLNNDMVLKKDTLTQLVLFAENYPSGAAFGSVVYETDKDNYLWSAGGKINSWTCTTSHMKLKKNQTKAFADYIPGTSVLYRLNVLEQLKGFDDRFFLYWEDVDIGHRIQQHHFQNVVVYNSIAYHKCGASHGRYNAVTTYYPIRNQLLYASLHLQGFQRLFFFASLPVHFLLKFFAIVLGKILFRREIAWIRMKMLFKAYWDFFKKQYGRGI